MRESAEQRSDFPHFIHHKKWGYRKNQYIEKYDACVIYNEICDCLSAALELPSVFIRHKSFKNKVYSSYTIILILNYY